MQVEYVCARVHQISESPLISCPQVPIYCVSHRRGEALHKFIATCGTTVKGMPTKAYFADDEERANANLCEYEIARKAPRILNDYTLAQPCLDRHNRYRQVPARTSPPHDPALCM